MPDLPEGAPTTVQRVTRAHTAARPPVLVAPGCARCIACRLPLLPARARPCEGSAAGPPAPRGAFARQWTYRDVLLVGLGDSVTAGFGARRGYGYFDRLVANPLNESADMKGLCLSTVLPHLRATNLSASGSVSLELLENKLPRLPVAGINTLGLIVITTGGNDFIHNYGRTPPREQAMYGATMEQASPWIKNFELRLKTVIANLKTRFPGGCQIFIGDIFDPTDGAGDTEHAGLPAWTDAGKVLSAYNEAIRRGATMNKEVHLVRIHDLFLGHGIHCVQFWSSHY